jgi:hypothetical protein
MRSRVHLRQTRLDGEGSASGWRCEPSPGVWVAVSVARRFGQCGLGFSSGAPENWLAWVGTIGQGARRGWRGIEG